MPLLSLTGKNICEDTENGYNHEAKPSQCTKGRRDEEQIRTQQTANTKSQKHKQRKTATEELSVGKLLGKSLSALVSMRDKKKYFSMKH